MNNMIKNVKGLNVMSEGPEKAKGIKTWTPWGNLTFDSFSLYKQKENYYLFARFRRESSRGHGLKLSDKQVKQVKRFNNAQSVIDFWYNNWSLMI